MLVMLWSGQVLIESGQLAKPAQRTNLITFSPKGSCWNQKSSPGVCQATLGLLQLPYGHALEYAHRIAIVLV